MKLFPPKIEVGDRGFTDELDIFGHKEFGQGLARLFKSSDDSIVVALDDDWGWGKTTFIKMWCNEVRQDPDLNCVPIYFDAFENDYLTEPLTALSAALYDMAEREELLDTDEELKREVTSHFKAVGKILAKGALGFGVRTLSGGLLSAEEVSEAVSGDAEPSEAQKVGAEKAGSTAEQSFDALLGNQLMQADADREAFENFRHSLFDLTMALRQKRKKSIFGDESEIEGSGDFPVVVVIDELDRCRPTFAIELLETLKHFFNIEGVNFLLAINMEQLKRSVKSIYGLDTGAEAYLRKFIHLHRTLPLESRESNVRNEQYVDFVIEAMSFPDSFGSEVFKVNTREVFHHFLVRPDVSLRDIGNAVTNVASAAISSDNFSKSPFPLIDLAILLAEATDSRTYKAIRLISQRISYRGTEFSQSKILNLINRTSDASTADSLQIAYSFLAFDKGMPATIKIDGFEEFDFSAGISFSLLIWYYAIDPPDPNEKVRGNYADYHRYVMAELRKLGHIQAENIIRDGFTRLSKL